MARVEKSIVVDVPLSTAYNQWTQFEEFPNFMEGVHEVTQLDDQRLHWRAEVGGREKEWTAEIREQVPDERITWSAVDGPQNAGIVRFEPAGPEGTVVHLEMSYSPEGFLESAGDHLGFMSRRVEGDLERFRKFIEERGVESGGYRGTISNGHAGGEARRGI